MTAGPGRPLEGIRVLEVAMYGFVPSCGAVLADWGADVVKVEHAVTGDPQRGLRQTGMVRIEGDPNPNIEHANRGKRSIGLDLKKPEGKAVLEELIRTSDVFLTSFLPSARRSLKIDVEDVRAIRADIVYARGSALGPRGEESERGGYDATAFWARGSVAASMTLPDAPGVTQPPGPAFGDTISGTNLAGGIAAALLKRERTGEASVVDVSLLGSGIWSMGHAIAVSLRSGIAFAPIAGVNGSPYNPLTGIYRTRDDRWISLVMLQPTRYWADVCRHVGRPELADDARFSTIEAVAENTAEGQKILSEAFATKTLAEWTTILATLEGPWAPVQDTLQTGADAQVRANEYIVPAGEIDLAASPVQFDVSQPELGPGPEFAAQTEEILLELGHDWPRIAELKAAGAVT